MSITVGTIVSAVVTAYATREGLVFWRMFVYALSFWGLWGCFAPLLMSLGAYVVASRPGRLKRVFLVAVVGVPIVTVHLTVAVLVLVLFQPHLPVHVNTLNDAMQLATGRLLFFDLLTFSTLTALGSAFAMSQRALELELRESRLETELARAQLEALRLEIEPHFLFNTLHTISALVRTRANDRALKMLLSLSELMRGTLDGPREQVRPFATELEFTRHYIDIQHVRYGERLTVQYQVDEHCDNVLVPALLLQPLVENAFRHGLKRRSGGCYLTIAAGITADKFTILVRDNGGGLPTDFDRRHFGTGLRNTVTRLRQLYGDHACFEVRPLERGTEAYVAIPANHTTFLGEFERELSHSGRG